MTAAHDGPAEHLAAAIAAFRRRAWAAADAGTERDVRKARVAARRLRAILRLATAPEIEALRGEIADLASVLGKLRDLDVQVAAIEGERASADEPLRQVALAAVSDVFMRERAAARQMLAALTVEPRFRRLGASLDELAVALPPLEITSPAGRERQVARRHRRVRMAGDAIDSGSSPAPYHALRIAVKRLRYTLEVVDPNPGELADLRALQSLLGDHQDACVAEARLHEIARTADLDSPVRAEIERIAGDRAACAVTLRAEFPARFAAVRGHARPKRR